MTTAQRQSNSIEFIVKPREDLYLEGSVRTLPRVSKGKWTYYCFILFYLITTLNSFLGEPYPCQMQKNQTFSCLFRHYAKHNGLKKEGRVRFKYDKSKKQLILIFSNVYDYLITSLCCRFGVLFRRWTAFWANAWNCASYASRLVLLVLNYR